MANTVKQSDIDKILKDNTDELSALFKSIQTDAFGLFKNFALGTDKLTDGFRKATEEITKLKTPAEQYLGIQKLQETIQSKINELKSKSSYLDNTALAFKSEELDLQQKITKAQMAAIESSKDFMPDERRAALNVLKIKMITSKAELEHLTTLTGKQNKLITLLESQSDCLNKITPTLEKQKDVWSSIKKSVSEFASEFPILTMLLGKMWEQFGAIENAAFAVRQHMGALIGDDGAAGLYKIVQNVSNQFANIGVTAEIVGKSIISISSAFGSVAFVSADIVRNFSALEASLGISGDTSAKVVRSLMGISQSSAKSQVSMIGFAQAFSTAAGVPLTEVMKDLSTISESVRTTFRGSTLQLVKSTVEARKLGLNITEVGNVAEKLLNFTESINAEIEASVMLGKNISFQDARTLAYKGDILGATKNILDTIEQTTDLNKLDALQLKSISEATGLTVGQLQDSLQIRKDLKELQLSGNEEARKQVDIYNQLNGLGKEAAATAGDAALKRIKETNNLARQKQIQAELLGLLYQVTDALMPIFKVIGGVASVFTKINNAIRETVGETSGGWVSAIFVVGATVLVLKSHWLSMFSSILTKIPLVSKALNAMGMGSSAAGAAGASKSFGKGAMFAGVGSFMKSLGTAATMMGAAASLYILAEALKNMPTDLGGLSIGEYMRDVAGGLAYLTLAFAGMGLLSEFVALGSAALILIAGGLALLGLSLMTIANPIKTFSDSFSSLMDKMSTGNLSSMINGIRVLKTAMGELRDELDKFDNKQIGVLDKLGNLTTNISAGTEVANKKESGYADLTNAIVNAIRTGMSNIQITVESNGNIKRNFREEITSVSRSGFNGVA